MKKLLGIGMLLVAGIASAQNRYDYNDYNRYNNYTRDTRTERDYRQNAKRERRQRKLRERTRARHGGTYAGGGYERSINGYRDTWR